MIALILILAVYTLLALFTIVIGILESGIEHSNKHTRISKMLGLHYFYKIGVYLGEEI